MRSVGSLSLVVATSSLICGCYGAKAQLDESALEAGEQAMAFPGSARDEARVLRLNGASLFFRTTEVTATLSSVLAHYEASCAGETAGLLSALATRAAQTKHDGYVACVSLGSPSLEELVSRLARFARTADLQDLGRLQYVYARTVDGDPARTFLFSLWSKSSFRFTDLLPDGGSDAPGFDPVGVPRPPDAQRIIYASESISSSSLYVYLTKAVSPIDFERRYRQRLKAEGWTLVERDHDEAISIDGSTLVAAQRGSRLLTVVASRGRPIGTVVTLLDSQGDT